MTFKPQDHYFKLAKQDWYLARSAYKLQEIDEKFHLFTEKTSSVIDIGCTPWSRMQFAHQRQVELKVKNPMIIWFDLNPASVSWNWIFPYVCDIQDTEKVNQIIESHKLVRVDMIISDMAPNTVGIKNVDAIRSVGLLEKTLWMYEKFLKPDWVFAIKIFMWPWFDEFVSDLKKQYWPATIRVFKPKSCRKESKEIYIVRVKPKV